MTLWTVPGTGYAQLLINSGDGPTMVINRDETVQLYIGDDNSVASKNGTGDIDIIDPLSYIVYDGVSAKYGISASPASIQVDTVKGATNWAPSPAQAAQQIQLLGLATSAKQDAQITTANNTNTALNTGIALPVGAAKETGNLQTAAGLLAGTSSGALVQVPGNSVAKEVSALLATGNVAGTPGGVPLQNLQGFIMSYSGPVTIGAPITVGTAAHAQTSALIYISVIIPHAATVPFASVQIQWIDHATNFVVGETIWDLVCGDANFVANQYGGIIPAIADFIQVSINCYDPSQTITAKVYVWQVSQVADHSDIQLIPGTAYTAPTFTMPDYSDIGRLILGSRANAALGASSGDGNKLLPLYSGKVGLVAHTAAANNTLQVFAGFATGNAPPANANLFQGNTDANGNLYQELILPRSPCTVSMRNTAASAESCYWEVIALK